MKRRLGVTTAILLTLLVPTLLLALALDHQPITELPRALGACAIAYGTASGFAVLLSAGKRAKVLAMMVVTLVLALLPFLVPQQAHAARVLVGVVCGLLMLKLYDLYLGSKHGVCPDATTSRLFLATPFLVFRRIPSALPRAPREESARFVRSTVEAMAGAILLAVVFQLDWRTRPFIFEHAAKAIALCLMLFPAINALMSLIRLLGGCAQDFTDRPFTARTPAEFWRRYNRWVGQFFYEDVFKWAGGRRSPVRATLLVFLLSGLLHEYLFFVAIGRAFGYQLAFFAIQGIACAATLKWRPKGRVAAMSLVLTLVFNLVTSVLFFGNVARMEPFYSRTYFHNSQLGLFRGTQLTATLHF